jgi:hypothetical protein
VFDAGDLDACQYPAFLNQWEKVSAEEPGFVLVNRYRTSPALFPVPPREEMRKGRVKGAKIVFARTTLPSAKESEHLLKIGYSDDTVVYLNRKADFFGEECAHVFEMMVRSECSAERRDPHSSRAGRERTAGSGDGI